MEREKRSVFETPFLSTKIKSANAKMFPEGIFGYFLGPTLALLANSILTAYLNKYMQDVLGMNEWAALYVTVLPIASVVAIITGNIFVGRLMNKSRTKAGKARPLLLLAVPLSILALLILFVLSPMPDGNNHTLVLILFAIGYNLWFAVAYPFYYTSHAAIVNLSTRNNRSRSLFAMFSNATILAAMGLTNMVLPFFLDLLFVPTEGGYDTLASFHHWKIFIVALMAATAIGIIIEYFFTRERITEETFGANVVVCRKNTASIGRQAKICLKDKYWWLIIVSFFLYQFGGSIKNVSQIFYCEAWFGANYGGLLAALSMIGAIPTALGMVIAWPLGNKIGKGKAIMCGAVLAVAGGAIGFIAPGNFYVVAVSFAVKALGSTPAMYLSLALLADILDHQEAQHSIRTDGFTMAVYGAIIAGMTGIVTGIMNGIYSSVGRTAATASSEAVRTASTWIFIGGETICYLGIFVLFIFMTVERFTSLDHKAIASDQKAKAEAEGVEYVAPAVRLQLEEEQTKLETEQARKVALKEKCEKKGIDFEQEEHKYACKLEKRQAAAEKKKERAEARKEASVRKRTVRLASLSPKKRAAIEQKQRRKRAQEAEKSAAVLLEFNALRQQNGKPPVTAEEELNNFRTAEKE